MIVIADCEANGLLPTVTKLHIFVFKELNTDNWFEFTDVGEVIDFITNKVSVLIGHNFFGYDLPLLSKLGGVKWNYNTFNGKPLKIIDSYALSNGLNPDRETPKGCKGPHGLEAWGKRTGIWKPEVNDWEGLDFEVYQERCIDDVKNNEAAYNMMMNEFKQLRKSSKEYTYKWLDRVNYGFYHMGLQARAAIQFDKEKAVQLYNDIQAEMDEIEQSLMPHLPKRKIPKSKLRFPPRNQFKKDGSPSSHSFKYFSDLEEVDGEWKGTSNITNKRVTLPLDPTKPEIEEEQITLAHQQDIKEMLVNKGWEPTMWNTSTKTGEQTTPKFHEMGKLCPNLKDVDWPYIEPIIKWLSLNNRRNNLSSKTGGGWINSLDKRGRISQGTSGLTNTHRWKHRTVVNLPGVKAVKGKEIRSLFKAKPGSILVGWDASSLENRIKAHLTYKFDGGEYAKMILDPNFDAHSNNSIAWFGDKSFRQRAKAGEYALAYNCGVPTLARTLKVSESEAKKFHEDYWKRNWPIKACEKELEKEWNKNNKRYILGLDGTPLMVRSKNNLFNTACQGGGSIVMEYSWRLLAEQADRVCGYTGVYWFKGLPVNRVLYSHDEFLCECHPDIAEWINEEGVNCIKKAGEVLGLSVNLDGEGKIDHSYDLIH